MQNVMQWLCSMNLYTVHVSMVICMYSQSHSSSLPEGMCGPPRQDTGGKINKGEELGCDCGYIEVTP